MVSNISNGLNIFRMVVGIALLFTAIISGEASAQIINTVAGNGIAGYSGDGGPAVQAQFNNALDVAVGTDGSFYIADYYNYRIRRVGSDGIITTVVGNGIYGFSGDRGPATQAQLTHPVGVAVGTDGSLYIADFDNHRIRRVGSDGIITTVAGNGIYGFSGDGGPATQAQLAYPSRVAVGSDGSLYIADHQNWRVRRVGLDGIITTIAGNGVRGFGGDGGPATQAQLNYPIDVAMGSDGLYIADYENNRVRRVGSDGIITTVAGNGIYGFSGDGGLATQAQFGYPQSVVVGSDGSLYIADFNNHRVRRVGSDGIITTVVGNGIPGFSGDGGPATQAQLYYPIGLSVGSDGSLYIADISNNRIRRVAFDIIPPLIVCDNTDGLWHGTDVSIACTASDSSGLAYPDDASFSLSTNVANGEETINAVTDSRTVCDMAGNCATAGPISGNMVDKKAPSISILAPINAGTYTLNQVIAASYSCNDGGSGIDTCNGPVPNGINFDTNTVGSKIFTVNAKDLVGNTASATNNYNVIYNFNGFFRPVDNIPTLNTVKAGSAIPMKFSLSGNQGLNIFPSGYPISQKIDCDTSAPMDDIEETVTAGQSSLSYDATADQYNYVWKTDKAWTGTCRQMIVRLNDGTDRMANFKFR